jgi:hypothetical protein
MRLRWGVVVVVGAATVVLVAGCGGGTKTVTQTTEGVPAPSESSGSEQGEESVSLGGSGEKLEYPSVKAVGQAIITDIEERYGDSFESGECENFLPEAGGAPLYTCEIKIGGEWHGDITATIHPDGSFEWRDESESPGGDYEGRELSVSE